MRERHDTITEMKLNLARLEACARSARAMGIADTLEAVEDLEAALKDTGQSVVLLARQAPDAAGPAWKDVVRRWARVELTWDALMRNRDFEAWTKARETMSRLARLHADTRERVSD